MQESNDASDEPRTTEDAKEDIFARERQEHEEFQKQVAGSWEKTVLASGEGSQIVAGNRVTVHVVGHLHSLKGHTYESSRDRGVPLIIISQRGSLVPGLDAALLSCKQGEQAIISVKPAGAYGTRGLVDDNGVRKIPGSCTLVFEIEVVKVEDEVELWNMDFATKMRYASEYRERGNTLFRNQYYDAADDEYELAMRYLLFNAHPNDEELPIITEGLVAVQLNLAASKLRIGREKDCISQAQKVLELAPNQPKALYRIGQAHIQLGNYGEAKRSLEKAIAASDGDERAVKACKRELDRLAQRQERHKRQQKKAYAKMILVKQSRFRKLIDLLQDPNHKVMVGFAVALIAVLVYIVTG